MRAQTPVASGASPAAGQFVLAPTGAGRLAARGPLTFATARSARQLGLHAITTAGAGALEADCGGVSASDSAGLAVLIDWLALARAAGRSLRYTNLPEGLVALARISEVEQLLERGA